MKGNNNYATALTPSSSCFPAKMSRTWRHKLTTTVHRWVRKNSKVFATWSTYNHIIRSHAKRVYRQTRINKPTPAVLTHAEGETEKKMIYHNVSNEAIFIPEDAKF